MIISECGICHDGDMAKAKVMIEVSKECGDDLVKFQLYDPWKLFPSGGVMIQGKNWFDYVKTTELSKDQAKMLFEYGEEVGIEVFFSVFDVERVGWCEEIGVKRYKIAYSQRDNYDLLDSLPYHCTLYISDDSAGYSRKDTTAFSLYCTPLYPTPLECINFYRLGEFDGFSDHTIGTFAPFVAMSRGAKIIEKHFTLDKNSYGCDHFISADPKELREIVDFARKVEIVL